MDKADGMLPRASTGVAGLDNVMEGGLARNRLHLLEGSPGTGKDHDRACNSCWPAPRPARSEFTSAWPRPSRSCATARARTAGRSGT